MARLPPITLGLACKNQSATFARVAGNKFGDPFVKHSFSRKEKAADSRQPAPGLRPDSWTEDPPIASSRSWQFPVEEKERAPFLTIPNIRPAGGHVGSKTFPKITRHGAESQCKHSPLRVPFQGHIFPDCLPSCTWTSLLPRPKTKILTN